MTREIVDKTLRLSEFPQFGKVVREIGNESIRELYMYSYRILYEIKDDHNYVLAVVHKRQDFEPENLP